RASARGSVPDLRGGAASRILPRDRRGGGDGASGRDPGRVGRGRQHRQRHRGDRHRRSRRARPPAGRLRAAPRAAPATGGLGGSALSRPGAPARADGLRAEGRARRRRRRNVRVVSRLADGGAARVSERIPNAVPWLRGNEWAYLKECLETNWVSSAGPFVERFERELAERVGVSHAVAVVNGTAALHVALLAAGVRPGDAVLVPSLTFIATVN